MKYLIDTHIMLWAMVSPESLTSGERRIIEDINNQIYVSTASIWECGIKRKLGKLDCPDDLLKGLRTIHMQTISINDKHVLLATDLPDIHSDPFDRVIIAQAKHEGLTLITRDANIKRYSACKLWKE